MNNKTAQTTEDKPRYVRILYLKEVKKPKQLEQPQEVLADKKSLAYLSSLIQDERKIGIKATSPKISNQQTSPYLRSQPNYTQNPFRQRIHSYTPKSQHDKTKQNMLSQMANDLQHSTLRNVVSLSKKQKPKLQIKSVINGELKDQLQKDFVRFCIDLKHTNKKYPYKCILPTREDKNKKMDEVKKAISRSFAVEKPEEKANTSHSISKTFKASRPNIVFRKNFKEIDNFRWDKVNGTQFTLEF